MTILIIAVLVALSGLFSGLTLGLLGLDKTELQRKIRLGNKRAKKVYEVRKDGTLLLTTLLIGNVGVNAAISILLNSLSSGLFAGLISTGLIVLFGEILPQAAVSRYALAVGSRTVWLVKLFELLLFPIAWPIARTLDAVLGKELATVWSKKEIETIIEFHEDHPNSTIDADEERIIKGALQYSDIMVSEEMTPRKKVFLLEASDLLDDTLVKTIQREGFTRMPVYEKHRTNIIGVLYAKQLIGLKESKRVADVMRKKALWVRGSDKLDSVLNKLVGARTHIACVGAPKKRFEGIITLEDILERIIRREIRDEDDT